MKLLEKLQNEDFTGEEDNWALVYVTSEGDDLHIRTFHNLDDKNMWLNQVIIGMSQLAMEAPLLVTQAYMNYVEANPDEDAPEQTAEDLPSWAKVTKGSA